jgi:negative regulator of replication initiation
VRTTLNLDDDVLEEVKQYACRRSVALGKAASDLIRRGLSIPLQTKTVNGLQVVVLPDDAPPVDSARVKSLLEDEP